MGDLWDGIQSMTTQKRIKKVGEVIGLAYFWEIWKQRNEKLFTSKMSNVFGIVNAIQARALVWLNVRSRIGMRISWDDWSKDPLTQFVSVLI